MKYILVVLLVLHFVFADQTYIGSITPITTFGAPDRILDGDFAEIVAFDGDTNLFFVANSGLPRVDVFDVTDVTNVIHTSVDISAYGGYVTSVASFGGLIAAAVPAEDKVSVGKIVFIEAGAVGGPTIINSAVVGSLPDSVHFSPKGNLVLVANEGEPNDDYTIDPEGTISVIQLTINGNKAKFNPSNVAHDNALLEVTSIGFSAYNSANKRDESTRFFGSAVPSNPTFAVDVEPEYIAISHDERTAWVTLQEANAIAEIDLRDFEITSLIGLGFKNHSSIGNHVDASDEDGINIAAYPVFASFQPDQIYYFVGSDDREYLLVGNEGDDRKWEGTPGYTEMVKLSSVELDTSIFDVSIQETIGNLRISQIDSDANNDGLVDKLYISGGRSFAIYDIAKERFAFESGDAIENLLASQLNSLTSFNSDDVENQSADVTSPKRGPEPEGVTIAEIDGVQYGFIGFDKQAGFVCYNLSNPRQPTLVAYVNNRDFSVTFDDANFATFPTLDLGPEGLLFLDSDSQSFYDSGNELGSPVLAVSNSASGTITLYSLNLVSVDGHSTASSGSSKSSQSSNTSDSSNAHLLQCSLFIMALLIALLC